jgi:K+-transporting ATPase ATPase C chain
MRMKRQIITGLRFLIVFIILTGLIYPGLITAITSLLFSYKSQGSLIEKNGVIIGSKLIGQNSESADYFWSRPSINNYDPLHSGGSNLAISNPLLKDEIIKREQTFLHVNNIEKKMYTPSEMVTASASGLDPHISPTAALLQVDRIADARGMNKRKRDQLVTLINDLTEKRQFSILGEPRINVFLLNLMTDSLR